MEPISLQSIVISKDLLADPEVFGAMDRGCTLSKFVFQKPVADDTSKVSLQMALFANKDFDCALQWLAARIKELGVANKKFHVTGLGGEKFKEQVASATGFRVQFVDEFVSQTTGAGFFLKNLEDDEFCYPDNSAAKQELPPSMPPWILQIIEKAKELYSENEGKRLPAIFVFCGSATGINVLNADDSLEVLGATMFGGKSMLGMSKLMLGTGDYDELMSLAARGNRGNVDTQAFEMVLQDETSQFRMMPRDMSLFHMGKAADVEDCEFAKEDVAAAIVGTVLGSLLPLIGAFCKMKRVPKVYIGGHFFKAQVARDIFHSLLMSQLGMLDVLQFRFLSNGHTGCIGAMLVTPEEAEKRKMNMKF